MVRRSSNTPAAREGLAISTSSPGRCSGAAARGRRSRCPRVTWPRRLQAIALTSLMWALLPASSSSPEALADEKPAPRGRTLREEAVARYNERRYFQAIELGERALEAADRKERDEILTLLARFQSALGVELFNAGEYRSAEEAFQKALGRAE